MGLFGKPQDYTSSPDKKSVKRTVCISIENMLDTSINDFDIDEKEEYATVKLLEELSSGKIKSATIIDEDGDKWILSSLYIRNSLITIIKD